MLAFHVPANVWRRAAAALPLALCWQFKSSADPAVSALHLSVLITPTGTMACCKSCTGASGPGYATPLDAVLNGPRETLLYLPAIVPDKDRWAK